MRPGYTNRRVTSAPDVELPGPLDATTVLTNPALAACWLAEASPEELTVCTGTLQGHRPTRPIQDFLLRIRERQTGLLSQPLA